MCADQADPFRPISPISPAAVHRSQSRDRIRRACHFLSVRALPHFLAEMFFNFFTRSCPWDPLQADPFFPDHFSFDPRRKITNQSTAGVSNQQDALTVEPRVFR